MLAIERIGIDELPRRLAPYRPLWAEQRRLHDAIAAGDLPNTVLLLEHAAVYTAGRSTRPENRPDPGLNIDVVDVDRGGDITWHGPGQLVGYPLLRLPQGVYVVDYVRLLEQVVIDGLADFGLTGIRVQGRTGVWLAADSVRPERKICAIGVRYAHGVTMHGFALNVDPDLRAFDAIVPCGIRDAGVTSLACELPAPPSLPEVADVVSAHLTVRFANPDRGRRPARDEGTVRCVISATSPVATAYSA